MRAGPAALAVAAALLLIPGCGGDDRESAAGSAPEALEGEEAAQALADAAEATTSTEETVDASLSLAVTGAPTGDMALDFTAQIDPGERTGEFVVSSEAGAFTARLASDQAWLTSDSAAFTDALPEGAEWVEVDIEELSSLGLQTSFDEGGLTPQLYLALGAVDPVAGEEGEVGGDAVRTYSFGIDQQKAVEESPPEVKQQVEDAVTLQGEDPTIEGEAAIDGDGLMRRMSVVGSAGIPVDLGGGEFEVSFDVEYTDFGVEVPTETPDPATVVPLSEAPDAATAIQDTLLQGS